MMPAEEELIRSDFRSWSGGGPPESPEQIFLYMEYTADPIYDRRELMAFLENWACSDDE